MNRLGFLIFLECEEFKSAVKKVTAVAGLSSVLKPVFISSDTCKISTALIVGGVRKSIFEQLVFLSFQLSGKSN